MPLETDIHSLALGEAADGEGRYLFLVDAERDEFVAGCRFLTHRGYAECVNLVSSGYGPTLFLLLMQLARREGLRGVAPDLEYNSDEAKRMDERLYADPPPGVRRIVNPDGRQAEVYLNQIYFLDAELIPEAVARRNADRYFRGIASGAAVSPSGETGGERAHRSAQAGPATLERLKEYLFRSELPFKDPQ